MRDASGRALQQKMNFGRPMWDKEFGDIAGNHPKYVFLVSFDAGWSPKSADYLDNMLHMLFAFGDFCLNFTHEHPHAQTELMYVCTTGSRRENKPTHVCMHAFECNRLSLFRAVVM